MGLGQVEDRDAPFLLDVGIAPDDRPLVEFDRNDPLCRRVRVAHAVRASTWPRTKGKGVRPPPFFRSCRALRLTGHILEHGPASALMRLSLPALDQSAAECDVERDKIVDLRAEIGRAHV